MRGSGTELPAIMDTPGAVIRETDWGGLTCVHITLGPDADFGPLLKGLPDDHCPVPHWGYVLAGSITISCTDGQEETPRARGTCSTCHRPYRQDVEGITHVEFSPARELKEVYEHVGRQMQS